MKFTQGNLLEAHVDAVVNTVNTVIAREGAAPTLPGIRQGIRNWPTGAAHAQRKERLFNDRLLQFALDRLRSVSEVG